MLPVDYWTNDSKGFEEYLSREHGPIGGTKLGRPNLPGSETQSLEELDGVFRPI